ncbi:hypothetical protein BO70DRAFT_383942 [Aspergillus heteromorphus CBS 117.55]|uniref:Zn(2)-C6 fungal-type domain-containing protein n=1 Tax=Aspergillus heteromorphus CBS 117.55 TaxID=1448321 RepID=A0A317X128_9EURO|nr:uncharacterized protein BO70DRAFT_383942 [Aspergillus heteromorphus CBS 117.55]PWY92369.1 hypothetical protein BO70DRAFT_383942 [Aspergillus heteromorphus CBS 117.55]
MPRRAHKKSRNGCLECKRRHIKVSATEACDEKQPLCSNCRSSERFCEYADPFVRSVPPRSSNSSTPSPAGPMTNELLSSGHLPVPLPPVNLIHVELLYNLTVETLPSLAGATSWITSTDLLAFSALHLSISRPADRERYRRYAAQLQTHALEIYNQMSSEVTTKTCVPLFLFSCMLGMHMLCDVLVYRENSSFDGFLDRYVHSFRLQLGIRAVISGSSWEMLRESILRAPLQNGEISFNWDVEMRPQCQRLIELIESAKLGDAITSTYRHAIMALNVAMNAAVGPTTQNINGITGWTVIVNPEYVEYLVLRRPEALVILAHYAVLIHWHRGLWLFGDSGRFLIESISNHLGPDWAQWLEWPNRFLRETDVNSQGTNVS